MTLDTAAIFRTTMQFLRVWPSVANSFQELQEQEQLPESLLNDPHNPDTWDDEMWDELIARSEVNEPDSVIGTAIDQTCHLVKEIDLLSTLYGYHYTWTRKPDSMTGDDIFRWMNSHCMGDDYKTRYAKAYKAFYDNVLTVVDIYNTHLDSRLTHGVLYTLLLMQFLPDDE